MQGIKRWEIETYEGYTQLPPSSDWRPLAVTHPAPLTAIVFPPKYAWPCLPKIKSVAPLVRTVRIEKRERWVIPQYILSSTPEFLGWRKACLDGHKIHMHINQRDFHIGWWQSLENQSQMCSWHSHCTTWSHFCGSAVSHWRHWSRR